jgi:glycosyltransferase involved in cell wall biosynthesis
MTPNRKLLELFERAGLRVFDRGPVRENPLAYLWRSLGPADVAWLSGVMRETRATIAHLHTLGSHVVGTRAARRVGIPALRTEHHVQYFLDPSSAPFTRWSLARVDRSVAISRYVEAEVARIAPRQAHKLRVVRNGVDVDYFAPRPHAAADSAPFTFAIACRLEPWKGVDLVLEALALSPRLHVDVIGDGSERARLEALAKGRKLEDRARFLGYLRDPRDAIAAADAVVSASRDEPLGLSVLEALAMARPVVAFAGGGIPEIVKHGETGWLARDRSAEALGRAMTEAAESRERARAFGEAGRAFVVSECRIERMCEGYRAVYEELS